MPIASTGTTANNFRYSGEWLDPNLSFYNLRARYYNQLTGRFLSMDPYQGRTLEPHTLHKYGYAQDNPIDQIDPVGLDAILEVVFVYVRFDITPAPSPKTPWLTEFYENNEELPLFAYERLHNFAFARDIGNCDKAALGQIAGAVGGASGGPETGNQFLDCLVDAFEEEMSPIPFVPLPLGSQ